MDITRMLRSLLKTEVSLYKLRIQNIFSIFFRSCTHLQWVCFYSEGQEKTGWPILHCLFLALSNCCRNTRKSITSGMSWYLWQEKHGQITTKLWHNKYDMHFNNVQEIRNTEFVVAPSAFLKHSLFYNVTLLDLMFNESCLLLCQGEN